MNWKVVQKRKKGHSLEMLVPFQVEVLFEGKILASKYMLKNSSRNCKWRIYSRKTFFNRYSAYFKGHDLEILLEKKKNSFNLKVTRKVLISNFWRSCVIMVLVNLIYKLISKMDLTWQRGNESERNEVLKSDKSTVAAAAVTDQLILSIEWWKYNTNYSPYYSSIIESIKVNSMKCWYHNCI